MKLAKLDGMSWEELVEFLERGALAFAMETGPELEVARTAYEHNAEAAAAVAVAFRFEQVHGAACTLYTGLGIYERLTPDSYNMKKLRMEVAWVSKPYKHKEELVPKGWTGPTMTVRDFNIDWPIQPYQGDDADKHGGLANVMLAIASRKLAQGSNTEIMAAIAIREFLDEGMRRKDEKNGKSEKECGI